jgi:hypothetical protein
MHFQIALDAKGERAREHARKHSGARHRSAEVRRQVADALRRMHALGAEARAEEMLGRECRYITRCITVVGDKQICHVEGIPGDDGNRVTLHVELPVDAHPKELLRRIMLDPTMPMVLRLDVAKTLAAYQHRRRNIEVTVVDGPSAQRMDTDQPSQPKFSGRPGAKAKTKRAR